MENLKTRMATTALAVFVFSGFMSINEPRHLAWGRKAPAEVVEAGIGRDPGSRRGREAMLATLSFRDADGQTRAATDILPPDAEIAPGDRVVVQYIPGDIQAVRVEGNRSLLPAAIFLGGPLAIGAFVATLIREASEPHKTKTKRRPAPAGPKRR